MLIVFAFLATPGAPAKKPQCRVGDMPPWRMVRPENNQPRNEKTRLRRALRQGTHGGDQFRSKPLIGIEMQLPRIPEHQVVDGPVSLGSVAVKRMLHHLRSILPAKSNRVIGAERVDHVQIIGNLPRLRQSHPDRLGRVVSENNNRRLHGFWSAELSIQRTPASLKSYRVAATESPMAIALHASSITYVSKPARMLSMAE